MSRLPNTQARDITTRVAVFGDHDTVRHRAAQTVGSGLRHLPGCLAQRDQDQPAGRGRKPFQRARHRLVRQHGADRSVDNARRVLTNFHSAQTILSKQRPGGACLAKSEEIHII